jgi:hypothetical protein
MRLNINRKFKKVDFYSTNKLELHYYQDRTGEDLSGEQVVLPRVIPAHGKLGKVLKPFSHSEKCESVPIE